MDEWKEIRKDIAVAREEDSEKGKQETYKINK